MIRALLGSSVLLASFFGCVEAVESKPKKKTAVIVETPAPARSAQPNLAVRGDALYLSWIESPEGAPRALRFASLRDGVWSEPRTIVRAENLLANWADFPSLAFTRDGTLVAHWLERTEGAEFSYDIRIATSRDDGRSWSDPVTPHRDGTATEHGFVSLIPDASDGMRIAWLDGRAMAEGGQTMRLYTTVWNDGAFSEETLIDGDVCTCCQTSAVETSRGPAVVYRDRTTEDIRDIRVAYLGDDGWSEPELVHADGWEIDYCPVNGPAIDAIDGREAVAWFSRGQDEPRVLLRFLGAPGEPVRIDRGNPVGRVDLRLLPDGMALVSWLEKTEDGAAVMLRRVKPGDAGRKPVELGRTSSGRQSGFPRMVRVGGRIYVTWTVPGPPTRIELASLGG